MSLFDRIKNVFVPQQPTLQTKQSPVVMYNNVSGAYTSKDKYEDFAKEGYQQNAIVFRCVNEIAQGASSVPFKVFDGDIELDNHPLIDLLNRPSPQFAGVEFFQGVYSHLLLAGNSYVLKTMVSGQPRELHILRPDRMRIKPSKTRIPDSYEYVLNGKVVESWDADPDTGASEVKHFKTWHPQDDYYGLSPLSAGAVDVDQHNMSAKHNYNLLLNGARPSGAVIFKPKDESGMTVQLTEGQRQQLMSDLDLRFSGSSNAGRTMLLEGDFDFKEMGLSPKDMDFIQMKNMTARDIALVFGVPSQLVGVPDNQTYNNVSEARLALYEDTIIPLLKRVESDLNEWLGNDFNENVNIRYDIDAIPAMAERRKKIYENVVQAVREGILSRNEARDRLGYEPVEGGDEVYISANLFPLGEPMESAQEQETTEDDEKYLSDLYETKETDFPKEGDDKKISLRNSNFPQFDFEFAKNVKEVGVGKQIWKAGGNIRGNEAYQFWAKARKGEMTDGVLDWIKEREAWGARHFQDGKQFKGGSLEPNLSNVAGIVAQMKWGVIGTLGEQGMKDVILELTKKLEGRKEPEDKSYDMPDDEYLFVEEEKQVSEKVKKGLQNKVDKHNEKYGDNKTKRATVRMLEAVFRRGVGAYNTNPSSVRARVRSSDQWAFARVNSFLFALRTGRYQGGKHDSDLFPKGHPLSSK